MKQYSKTICKEKKYSQRKDSSRPLHATTHRCLESAETLAKKIKDPTIKSIRLYDFRHFFATNLYSKTRVLLLVKTKLGHKKINNTLFYTQLFDFKEDEYIVKGAETKEQVLKLIEGGFEYVTEIDNAKLFKKRK